MWWSGSSEPKDVNLPRFKTYKAWSQWDLWDSQQDGDMKRYTIEIRFDDEDDPDRAKAFAGVLKTHARTLFTSALLIAGRRKPTIAIHSDDHFVKQEIVLNDEPASAEDV